MAQHVYIDLGKFLLFSRKYSCRAFNKMKPSAVKTQYLKGRLYKGYLLYTAYYESSLQREELI